jgi:heme/copper-type cytochrome/quinol oxidase subunit 2
LHGGGLFIGSSSLQLILGVCGVIAAAVFATMIYSIVRFRTSPSSGLTSFAHRKTTEVLWALIPIAILVGTAVPTVKTLLTVDHSCLSASYGSMQVR